MSAPGSPSLSSITGARPRPGSKIVRQVMAVTTVRMAQGTSTTVRSNPRPLNASCMQSAIPSPITSSSATEIPEKTNVVVSASQNSGELNASE